MRALVIVPAFNEEASLPATLREIREKAPDCHVLVIDDGSRDRTAQRAREMGVPVLVLPINLGVGGALQTGFRYAMAEGYDVAIQLDADGQHDPSDLPALLGPLERNEADLVIGSRFVQGSGEYRAPIPRRIGMTIFSTLASSLIGRKLTDTTSGFRAYGRDVMALCLDYFPQDFPDAPLLIWLARNGVRWVEVPTAMRPRRAGESFYTFTRKIYYPYKILLASLIAFVRTPVGARGTSS